MMGKKQLRLVMRSSILAVLAIALTYTLYANFTKEDNKAVAKNEPVPDFVLTDLEGNTHRLSDYRGQGVFLNFWGTWCKPCEAEMPNMNSQYAVYKDQGVQILAVNVGEPKVSINSFAAKYDLDFPILIDQTDEVQDAYGVSPLPVTFLIDKDGNLVDTLNSGLTEPMVKEAMERIKP